MGSKRSSKQATLQQQGGKGNIRRAPGKMVNAKGQAKKTPR